MHSSLLTASNSSVFFTGINSLPEKYASTCIFSSTCVCCAPASSCDLLGGGKLGQGCTHSPALCSCAPAPLRSSSGSQGGWDRPRRCSAIPAAVLAALELPLGLTYCLVSLNIIAHCWWVFFSFPFDSVALVPYSDSSSISQSGESEETENWSSADFFCTLWKCPCAMCDSNLFFL